LNLRVRDVGHALPFFIQMLFFASPIVYSVSRLSADVRELYLLNPMAFVIDGFRAILLGTHPFSWGQAALAGAVALVVLVGGILYFERSEHRFADVA
jgi:lipopolysaccharide transport system permease protein